MSAMVADKLGHNPFAGHLFVFRGRRGDLIKVLWWDGDGLCLFAKRLERRRFVWPRAEEGTVSLTRAQLAMLLNYGHFYKSALYPTLRRIDVFLIRRARRKFKRFRQRPKAARDWLARVVRSSPGLFAHWSLLYGQGLNAGSRMS